MYKRMVAVNLYPLGFEPRIENDLTMSKKQRSPGADVMLSVAFNMDRTRPCGQNNLKFSGDIRPLQVAADMFGKFVGVLRAPHLIDLLKHFTRAVYSHGGPMHQ